MEQFNPAITITAVDQEYAVVTFDSLAPYDEGRAVKVVRIKRDFDELAFHVAGFVDGNEVADTELKEYRGTVDLLVKYAENEVRHRLADIALRLEPLTRKRRSVAATYPSSADVLRELRQGVSAASSAALASYYAKESRIDMNVRSSTSTSGADAINGRSIAYAPVPAHDETDYVGQRGRPAANDASQSRQKAKRRIIAAAVATPLLVYGALAAAGLLAKPADPVHEAVAQAMSENPQSIQAQVDLTKETLKQMGLDPGKAGDTGCLAPQ